MEALNFVEEKLNKSNNQKKTVQIRQREIIANEFNFFFCPASSLAEGFSIFFFLVFWLFVAFFGDEPGVVIDFVHHPIHRTLQSQKKMALAASALFLTARH